MEQEDEKMDSDERWRNDDPSFWTWLRTFPDKERESGRDPWWAIWS